jgi:23S rRNA (uracil1939-C5)-methyltransferase
MTISAPSFFQVNTRAAESLVSLALAELGADGSDRVLDLFAGAGTFTLPLAEKAGEVVAVESASSAVRDLRRNLEDEELWADVIGGDAGRELPAIGHVDLALVDPPRSGLHAETVDALVRTTARRIAYVSCDPATLARDAAALAGHGYSLSRATPIDLFPQTYHVETLALFERAR